MKNMLWLFLGCCLLASCWDEGELTPTPEPELIYGKYTLPQGDHDYDDDIVEFYKQYTSLILYKFTAKDFGWSPAWNAAYDVSKDTAQDIESNVSKYYAPAADEQYVGEQLQLLYNKLFDYLSDELMHLLPQKILLCSTIEQVPVGLGYDPTPEERTFLNVYSGYYHIAISWGSAKILAMTAEERNQFKVDVCTTYFEVISSALERPQDFFLISTYTNDMAEGDIYAEGILDYNNRNSVDKDWFDYIKLAIENSIEDLEAEGGVLNPAVDVNNKIREKYTIMTNFFKDRYKFDIQAIGNDVER